MIQFLDYPAQIPDAIAIAIIETAGIDLIDDTFLPPGFLHICAPSGDVGRII
jgi:hypothetical protein